MEKIKILDIDCCGCSACAVACPKNAIAWILTAAGRTDLLSTEIDASAVICVKRCVPY